MNDYIFIIGLLFCIYALTVVSLIASMNKKDREHTEERKDLLNRLMAKNTTEYIQVSNKRPKQAILTDGDILGDDRFDGMLN
ncbi:MAG TPA: hypothetical protein VJZ04_08130 [Lachnospiraceae bacterium]|nr:hypothetical protein [Lachnospiraceae bacterium]